jgi:hypothetical protein
MASKADKDLIATARERYKLAEEAEREIRREAKIDLEFAAGNQWDDADMRQRNAMTPGNKRPCLTFNKLTGPLNQVANQARMNKPDLEALAVDSSGDAKTATVIEGMIRHIQYASKADQVYETSLDQSTKGGFGYFKVTTKYCGNKTFDQEIRVERILNPFAVLIDPYAREADKSDMKWAFELEWISRDEYKAEFGDTEIVQMNWYEGGTNPAPDWIGKDAVLVARYWYIDIETKTLVAIQWPDGKVTSEYVENLPDELPAGVQYAVDKNGDRMEREDQIRHVKMCRLNGVEVLDETEWKGQWIPILAVLGEEMYIENKRYLFSLIRFARDPQKLYNFYRSSEAETVMLGTKAPWVGVKGAFKDPRWATANSVPWAYLEYEPLDIAGNPAPMPQRNLAEPPIQALSIGAAQAADDIKATTNVYDASLGSQSNEVSGIAIQRRQGQMELSNYHFVDNLNRAILQCGVILCDLIPKIYDTPRQVRILGEDMQEEIVQVNQKFQGDYGEDKCFDLTSGKYDVRLKIGPSFKTQRQETASQVTQLAQNFPQLMQVAGDIVFENLDFAGADQIADRLRRSMPPNLTEDPGRKPAELLAQQNQQQAQQIEQMTAALTKLSDDVRAKRIEAESNAQIEEMKIASSDRQAALRAQVDLVKLEANLTSAEDIQILRSQVTLLQAQVAAMASGAAAEAAEGPEPGEAMAGPGMGGPMGGTAAIPPAAPQPGVMMPPQM